MSHYTVLVVGDNPEEQLKPFDENLRETFDDMSDEVKEEYETKSAKVFYSDGNYEVYKETYDKLKVLKPGESMTYDVVKICPMEYLKAGGKYRAHYRMKGNKNSKDIWVQVARVNKTDHPDPAVCFEGQVILKRIDPPEEITLKEKYPNYNDYLKDWHGFKDPDEIGYWKNTEAKWDWYQLGGRWSGFFKLKSKKTGAMGNKSWTNEDQPTTPGTADQALKGDIDWGRMENDNFDELCNAYDDFEQKYETGYFKEKMHEIYFDYGVENTSGNREEFIPETREQFLNRRGGLRILCLLKDGKWYERGEMGWWGVVNDEMDPKEWRVQLKKLIEELPDDTIVSLYDCHI